MGFIGFRVLGFRGLCPDDDCHGDGDHHGDGMLVLSSLFCYLCLLQDDRYGRMAVDNWSLSSVTKNGTQRQAGCAFLPPPLVAGPQVFRKTMRTSDIEAPKPRNPTTPLK